RIPAKSYDTFHYYSANLHSLGIIARIFEFRFGIVPERCYVPIMRSNISVENGLRIAVRHPTSGATILAATLTKLIKEESWINDEYKLKLCILFVENLIDGSVESSIDLKILEKLKRKTFPEGLRLLKKRPKEGLKYLLVIIMEELRHKQNFNDREQYRFYDELLKNFFPGHSVSDFIEQ
ncbi:MAG: hypothetical protein KAG97_04765, partial [Victivallales bacterium]|nr:hypothetical protein [Victivallales bacterium]